MFEGRCCPSHLTLTSCFPFSTDNLPQEADKLALMLSLVPEHLVKLWQDHITQSEASGHDESEEK